MTEVLQKTVRPYCKAHWNNTCAWDECPKPTFDPCPLRVPPADTQPDTFHADALALAEAVEDWHLETSGRLKGIIYRTRVRPLARKVAGR